MRLSVLILLLASSCSLIPDPVIWDQSGNYYPPACQLPIGEMRRQAGYPEVLYEVREGYLAGVRFDGKIFITPELTGWRKEDAERHELCHVILGPWHD